MTSLATSDSKRDAVVRLALDTIFRDSLRPLAAWLGVLYLLFAAGHQLQPRSVAVPMTRLAPGTAVAMFTCYLLLRHRPVPVRWAHPAAAAFGILVLVNSLAHLYHTDDPIQTTNLMFFIMGTALLFLSTPWFVLIVVENWIGWGVIAWFASPSPAWRHFGFALIVATILSAVLHKVRIDSYSRSEISRIRDQQRQVQATQRRRSSH